MTFYVGVTTNAGRGYVEHATKDRESRPELYDKVPTLCGSRITVKRTPSLESSDRHMNLCKRCRKIEDDARWNAKLGALS